MCLHLNESNKPKVAKRKITCYKVLEEYSNGKVVSFRTPYRLMDVELGKTYVDDKEVKFSKYGLCITSGVFHSFKKHKDAVKLMADMWVCDSVFVVECVIPKGTEYYEGTFDNREPCYGSKAIQYTEKILAKYFWSDEKKEFVTEYPNSGTKID